MPLTVGTKIGNYEIQAPLGEGGRCGPASACGSARRTPAAESQGTGIASIRRFVLAGVFLLASTPSFGQHALSVEQWRTDLAQLVQALRDHHANLFHTVSEEELDRAVRELDDSIPTLADFQIVTEMKRLVAMIGDGHTALRGGAELLSGYYPLRLYAFQDGLYVRSASSNYPNAVGARVVAINGTPADDVFDAALSVTHGDNAMSKWQFVTELLTVPELLWGLGVVPAGEGARFELEDPEGQHVTLEPALVSFDARVEWLDAREAAGAPAPLYLSNPSARFWFEYLPEPRTLYVQFNAVRDGRDETVADFFQRVFEFADANRVNRFVLDIRLNGGGNKRLNPPIIEGLVARPWLDQPGKLFVIIGRGTFSAAVHLATELEARTKAIFVGEPTGGRPNHYGDSESVRLSNSGLVVTPATIYWEDSVPTDDRPWIPPDVSVPMTIEHYRDGRDAALEAVLAHRSAVP